MGKVPVEALSHITEQTLNKVKECKKFNDYVKRIDAAESGVQVSKI